jgi:UDPglucose 6-dehydrogenase
MISNPKIGIIGVGFVGEAVRKYFVSRKIKPLLYDKFKRLGSAQEVSRAEIVFICVPTPYHKRKGFDLSAVKEVIGNLKGSKIVVIKSTILPGTTEALQKEFPRHKLLFNPEFLREIFAAFDMAHPARQILGVTRKSRGVAKRVMAILPKAPYMAIMPSLEAEVVKYMANSFLALRVVFANEFYDICRKLGADYKLVKDAVVKDSRIGDSHFDIQHGGYRGYGGSCFPKDVNAIIQLAGSRKIRTELLKAMRQINRKYLKQSGLDESYFLNNHHKKGT